MFDLQSVPKENNNEHDVFRSDIALKQMYFVCYWHHTKWYNSNSLEYYLKLNSLIWHTIILISYIPLSVTVLTYSITINFYPSAATSVVLSHIKGYWRLTSHIALHYISFWAPHSALFYQMTLTLKVSFILWNTTILLLISSIYFGINYTWILALYISTSQLIKVWY